MTLEIKQRERWHLPVLLLVILCLLAAVAVFAYRLGMQQSIADGGSLGETVATQLAGAEAMQAQLQQVVARNNELRGRLAVASQARKIEEQAAAMVTADLTMLRSELLAAQEQLEFYRGIVSPADARAGLRMHRFALTPVTERIFRYQLILLQAKSHDRMRLGKARFEIHGLQAGEPLTLKMAAVSVPEQDAISYGFRYFQEFSGELILPDDFMPLRVDLEVKPNNGRALDHSYDWAALLGKPGTQH